MMHGNTIYRQAVGRAFRRIGRVIPIALLRDMEWDMPALGIIGMCWVEWVQKERMGLN